MYKKLKTSKAPLSDNQSIIFWIVLIFTTLFFFWAPFQKALFNGNTFDFERPIYSTLVWSAIIMLLLSIFLFYRLKFESWKDIFNVLIWLIPLTYLISEIHAASSYYASNMLLIQFIYVLFFLIGLNITSNKLGNQLIQYGILITSYVVVIFGLMNWFGAKEFSARLIQWYVSLPGKMEYQDAVMLAGDEIRLTSTFQYANTYAAFLIVILLCAIYKLLHTKKWYSVALHGFMLVPIIVSFFLTLSRGAIVVLPFILLLVLPFMKLTKQVLAFVYLGIGFLATLLILDKVTMAGELIHKKQDLSSAGSSAWIAVIASVIVAIAAWLIQHFLHEKFENWIEAKIKNRFAPIILPVAGLIIGLIGALFLFGNTGATKLLPEDNKQRIENINFAQHSVLERGSFYVDSLKLFKDYPIIGAGGGAWPALYEKYQSYPYVSRQAHNFFLQSLVEVGVIGIIVLLGLIIAIFVMFIRKHLQDKPANNERLFFYIIAIGLLIHSLIDFDMSYVYIGILMFIALGGMIGNIDWKLPSKQMKLAGVTGKVYPALIGLFSLFLFFNATQYLSANSLYSTANSYAQTGKVFDQVMSPLNKALSIHKNQPDYTLAKIDFYLNAYNQSKNEQFYNEAMNSIMQLKATEPHNRILLGQQLNALLTKQQFDDAAKMTENEITNFPWDITLYDLNISLNVDLGNQARTQQKSDLRDQYWNKAFNTYKLVEDKTKELANLPKEQRQGREFGLTSGIGFALGEVEFIKGNYESAANYFKVGVSDQLDDAKTKQIVTWYLATLQKQNKNDQALLDKLIAKDPNIRQQIDSLVNAKW